MNFLLNNLYFNVKSRFSLRLIFPIGHNFVFDLLRKKTRLLFRLSFRLIGILVAIPIRQPIHKIIQFSFRSSFWLIRILFEIPVRQSNNEKIEFSFDIHSDRSWFCLGFMSENRLTKNSIIISIIMPIDQNFVWNTCQTTE